VKIAAIRNPYSQYIIPAESIADLFAGPEGSFIQTKDANFSKCVHFKKLGIHHVCLFPGRRTSLPHAESREEEFVFVISGNPHVWIDGYVYQLRPNCAVGFPSGTGIAHNFINNTDAEVELLVVGERTKKDNLCSFPVNPEQKTTCDIWWENAPKRPLGPHDGQTGPIQRQRVGEPWPAFVVDCTKLNKTTGWHYPGDSETFGEYARLTDTLQLNALGIGFERLLPGHRTAFPHSHKTEEEFVFILSGTATVWLNGFVQQAKPGTGIAFLPGTNIAHCLINNTSELLAYIVVGEAKDDAKEDRVFYPMNPLQNAQFARKKILWEDRPRNVTIGPHNGRPNLDIQERLALRQVTTKDETTILEVFRKSPTYFLRVDGCEPTLKTVQHAVVDGPPKRIKSYLKEFLLIEYDDKSIGVADIHINHPEPGIVYLGLLLITEDLFGKDIGRRSYELIEHYVKTTFDAKVMRLGVSDDNDVSVFWKKMGFMPNGRSYTWKGERKTANVTEFEKLVASKTELDAPCN
jgi:uncharacterized cupin superfamily protein